MYYYYYNERHTLNFSYPFFLIVTDNEFNTKKSEYFEKNANNCQVNEFNNNSIFTFETLEQLNQTRIIIIKNK